MIYSNFNGEVITCEGKDFRIHDSVVGNELADEYEGLVGYIFEIRTGEDKDTDNEGADIYVCFQEPEDDSFIKEIESRFSAAYQMPKTLEDISLDQVIMASDMLEVIE